MNARAKLDKRKAEAVATKTALEAAEAKVDAVRARGGNVTEFAAAKALRQIAADTHELAVAAVVAAEGELAQEMADRAEANDKAAKSAEEKRIEQAHCEARAIAAESVSLNERLAKLSGELPGIAGFEFALLRPANGLGGVNDRCVRNGLLAWLGIAEPDHSALAAMATEQRRIAAGNAALIRISEASAAAEKARQIGSADGYHGFQKRVAWPGR